MLFLGPAMSAETSDPLLVKIDLHGYRPRDFIGQPMATVVQQAWEMGAERLRFVHGHGRARQVARILQHPYRLARPAHPPRFAARSRAAPMDQIFDCRMHQMGCDHGWTESQPTPDTKRARSHRAAAAELPGANARSVKERLNSTKRRSGCAIAGEKTWER
jgi:hypothetical protein